MAYISFKLFISPSHLNSNTADQFRMQGYCQQGNNHAIFVKLERDLKSTIDMMREQPREKYKPTTVAL